MRILNPRGYRFTRGETRLLTLDALEEFDFFVCASFFSLSTTFSSPILFQSWRLSHHPLR